MAKKIVFIIGRIKEIRTFREKAFDAIKEGSMKPVLSNPHTSQPFKMDCIVDCIGTA